MEKYSQEFFVKQGKIGGQTYAKKYSKKERSEIAKKRWAKMKGEAISKYVKFVKKNAKDQKQLEGFFVSKKQHRIISKIAKPPDGFKEPKKLSTGGI